MTRKILNAKIPFRPIRWLWLIGVGVAAVHYSGWLALLWIGLFESDVEMEWK